MSGVLNRFVLAVIVLAWLTWLTGDAGFRAKPVDGPVRLAEFPGQPDYWTIRGAAENVGFSPGRITLSWNVAGEALVKRTLMFGSPVGAAAPLIRIAGDIERLGPATLEREKYRQTHFMVIFRSGDQALAHAAITRLSGQYAHQRFEFIVRPPPGSDALELRWDLKSPGFWELDDLVVQTVALQTPYRVAAIGLILAWALPGMMILRAVREHASRRQALAVLASLVFIVVGTGLSQTWMASLLEPVMALVGQVFPGSFMPGAQLVLKGGHVVGFCALGFLMFRCRRALHLNMAGAVLLVVALAAATEGFQRHRFNRTGELRDIGIDAIGIALGLLAFLVWRAIGKTVSSPAGSATVSRTPQASRHRQDALPERRHHRLRRFIGRFSSR